MTDNNHIEKDNRVNIQNTKYVLFPVQMCIRDRYKDVPILIRRPMGSSLPSGHTASSFASATILLHMNYKIGLIALALAFIISFSRLYLFVHFPSDVFFGLLSGIAVALINIPIALRLI